MLKWIRIGTLTVPYLFLDAEVGDGEVELLVTCQHKSDASLNHHASTRRIIYIVPFKKKKKSWIYRSIVGEINNHTQCQPKQSPWAIRSLSTKNRQASTLAPLYKGTHQQHQLWFHLLVYTHCKAFSSIASAFPFLSSTLSSRALRWLRYADHSLLILFFSSFDCSYLCIAWSVRSRRWCWGFQPWLMTRSSRRPLKLLRTFTVIFCTLWSMFSG